MTDSQHLLAEYRQNGSDAAFRELVTRYVALVYSTALRLVEGDTHRAEDVTQTVFVDLARKARTLPEDVQLGGWLHRDTCLVAGHTLRGERRRQARERQAVEMNVLQNYSEADFSQVAPLLDDAINELGEADRTAILLRFFEQQDFCTVGQALGSNEDAARMRVTRALEKLEEFLKRRGVTTSAASLGLVLAANAVQAVPVGLAVTISSAAALAGTTATIAAQASMNWINIKSITAVVAAAIIAGTGMHLKQHHEANRLREQNQTFQQQGAKSTEQIQRLTHELEDATRKLASLRDDNERLNRNHLELLRLRAGVARLMVTGQNGNNATDADTAAPSGQPAGLYSLLEKTAIVSNAVFEKELFSPGVPPEARKQTFSFKLDGSNYVLSADGIDGGRFGGIYWQKRDGNLTIYDPQWNKPEGGSGGLVETEKVTRMTVDLVLNWGIGEMVPGSAVREKGANHFSARTADGGKLFLDIQEENSLPVIAAIRTGDTGRISTNVRYEYAPHFCDGKLPIEFTRYQGDSGDEKMKLFTVRLRELEFSKGTLPKESFDPIQAATASTTTHFYSNNIAYGIGKNGKIIRVLTLEEYNQELEGLRANHRRR